MTDKAKKRFSYTVLFLGLLAIGFFVGRSTFKPKIVTEIVYEKGDTVTITKDSLVPVYIKKPIDTTNVILAAIKSGKFTDLFPVNIKDSLIYITKEDTAAVLLDWATERVYKETLFDIDTVGVENVELKVQYNRLQSINGTFVPVIKNVNTTVTKTKNIAPFVGAGITTAPEMVLNAGMFIQDKYGAMFLYEYDWQMKKSAAGLTVLYKF